MAAALLIASTSACGLTEPNGPHADVQARLTAARALWRSQALNDYTYVFARSCFCAPDFREPALVTVRGGTIASVVGATNGAPRDPAQFRTIVGLFDLIQEAIDQNAATINVEFDGTRGFVASAYIDVSQRVADEEYSIEARSLIPVR
jgi:hypothetical protein